MEQLIKRLETIYSVQMEQHVKQLGTRYSVIRISIHLIKPLSHIWYTSIYHSSIDRQYNPCESRSRNNSK